MAIETPPSITPVPLPAPQRGDRTTFSDRVDDFVTWLSDPAIPDFQALADNVEHNAGEALAYATNSAASAVASDASADAAALSAAGAAASETGAALAANVVKWVSGTNYPTIGTSVWSPTNYQAYRSKTVMSPSTVDPAADSPNWAIQGVQPFGANQSVSISADTSLSATLGNVVKVTSTVKGSSILLPAGTALATLNVMFAVKNVGNFALPVRDASGALLSVLPTGASGIYYCEDTSTTAGVWGVIAPQSKVGIVTGVAQINATALAVNLQVSAIPGVTGKALISYFQSGTIRLHIATLNTNGTISLGTGVSFSAGATHACTAIALTSTTGLAAAGGPSSNYLVYSLALNTTTNVITLGSSVAAPGVAVPTNYVNATPVQVDSDTASWLVIVGSTMYIVTASYTGGAPTAAALDITASVGGIRNSTSLAVVSGNVIASGNVAAVLYTVSGNTLTSASTQSFVAGTLSTSVAASWSRSLVSPTGKVIVLSGETAASVIGDKQFALATSGATLPSGPTGWGPIGARPQMMGDPSFADAFIAGSSYCVTGGYWSGTAGGSTGIRVMRASADALTEVAYGMPEDTPFLSGASTGVSLRAAAVDGQRCIAVGCDKDTYPQIMGLEIIKV